MANTTEGKAFEKFEPPLTLEEVGAAKAAGKDVLSFKGLPSVNPTLRIEHLAVKFALADGTSVTLLLNRLVANGLKALVEAANKTDWDGRSMVPGPDRN